eukprot:CAMPEP_0202484550 /NCGR_PEP_ID=MMETSP1361-20130828/3619_1 /ASSEMBLY_ACC=CAM_ASM_000849 /TAXON_ID=210615 /ORGANISM="Staurosira complex sp., Strain CCMP2646" /LENGTH=319 /DNA_ID=CAMNT_0049113239 /DNA_START=161 /DNA_END=1121 /DNA_ORIENTATION=+
MSSSANQYHMSFASGWSQENQEMESIGDSNPGDVAGDWDSPPVAKGKKTAGLDNNDFMFIGTKEELVSYENSQNKNKAKPASKKTRIPENPTAAGVRDSNWNEQYEDALSKCREESFASLVGGERVHNWMKTACVEVEHYERSTLSRSEYEYSVGSSSWKSRNIEKVHSLVEVFNKKHTKKRSDTPTSVASGRQPKAGSRQPSRCSSFASTGSDDTFYASGIHLRADAKCKNSSNQKLYTELVCAANLRKTIGRNNLNRGHYQAGKSWSFVARDILHLSTVVDSTAKAQDLLNIGCMGVLKQYFDRFFTHGEFLDDRSS